MSMNRAFRPSKVKRLLIACSHVPNDFNDLQDFVQKFGTIFVDFDPAWVDVKLISKTDGFVPVVVFVVRPF